MNSKVVFYKAFCSAAIPFTSTVAGALAVAMKDYPEYAFAMMVLVVTLNGSNAAFSGLSNFLSRTFADHSDAANGHAQTTITQ